MFLSKNVTPEAKHQAKIILAQLSDADKYKSHKKEKQKDITNRYAKAVSAKLMQKVGNISPK